MPSQQQQLIILRINGQRFSVSIEPSESLNYVIRERLGLTGTKRGCETGGCGSCTVLVDDLPVYSCMMYAMQAEGRNVVTVEGLQGAGGELDPVQKSFMEKGGLQCGYCTPGFIMSTKGLLLRNSKPSESEIRDALVGNLCRCTGYTKIFESVRAAASANSRKNR
ncbi:MAG TPA: (2Fe-2S)-binding protein [Nitrososphaerales archaeon]|nr:(2Fe-2S)-binding protein [Nitrososphaerales archaeon]